MKYSLDDYSIVPARITTINSRRECYPYNDDLMLPLFTAPMSSVINEHNYEIFNHHKINTIIPRNVHINQRYDLINKTFVAMGLEEFSNFLKLDKSNNEGIKYICIDIANGHMQKLLDLCTEAKEIYGGELILMVGNIANPATYADYAKVGIDFVRISIGNGSACTTAANSGLFYPMGSLIEETYTVKKFVEERRKYDIINNNFEPEYKSVPYIVADGGFNNFDQIIKALVLGADYVMLGKIFAKCEEACGEVVDGFRDYYGMSTRRAQEEFRSNQSKTSEGITFKVPIEYTLEGWCDNFISYLRSAMSYTNSRDLQDLKAAETILISPLARNSYFK